MKMDPIVYRLEAKENQGFTPFRSDNGDWISRRDIVVKPFNWKQGSAIQFTIEEQFSIDGILQSCNRKVCSGVFYDKDYPELKELMDNLSSGDLRGRTAEMTAHKLYWKLFAFSDDMKKFLPELVDYYEKFKEQQKI
jgi:hypothetical protein